jgi:hypothetical protein
LDGIFFKAASITLGAVILADQHKVDLDSHEALVEIVPELGRHFPGTRLWDIVDGKDASGEWKFRKAEVGM